MTLTQIARQNRLKALASLETRNIFSDMSARPRSRNRGAPLFISNRKRDGLMSVFAT